MASAILNSIDPPPRLTGDAQKDTVSVIQWLSAFYVKGVLSGGLLQSSNLDAQLAAEHPSLISLDALHGAADKFAYYTDVDTFALADLSPFARSILDDADAATVRATIGAGTVTGVGATAPITSAGGNNPIIAISDFVASGVGHASGAVPDPGAVVGAVKYLREDGTCNVPAGAGDVVGPAVATANNVAVFNGATGKIIKDGGTLGTAAFTASTAYDAAGAAAAVTPTTLGLVIGTNTQAHGAKLDSIQALASAAGWLHNNGAGVFTYSTPTAADVGADVAGAAAAVTPTTLGLVIGTNVQAYDADLTTWAGITPGANVGTALAVAVGTDGAFVVKGGALGSPSSAGTLPAFTLGGTVSGGGKNINNVIIGATTPLAGSFTVVTATGGSNTFGGEATDNTIITQAADGNFQHRVLNAAGTLIGGIYTDGTNLLFHRGGLVLTVKSTGIQSVGTIEGAGDLTMAGAGIQKLIAATSNGAGYSELVLKNTGGTAQEWDIIAGGTTSAYPNAVVFQDVTAGKNILYLTGGATPVVTFPTYTAASFVAGDKYVVMDANGNIHKSAVGPAS